MKSRATAFCVSWQMRENCRGLRCFQNTAGRESAGKLMEAMLAAAREEGASSVSLEVRESNVGAMRLYEEYGFCQEAVRKKYYQEPEEDAVIMWNRSL